MIKDMQSILEGVLQDAKPGEAVAQALRGHASPKGKRILVAVGKAAWDMAEAALKILKDSEKMVDSGIVITKYHHSKGELPPLEIMEAGHPVPDENSFRAARRALELTKGLSSEDEVIFLLSGGGSALFEDPLIPGEELASITSQLLAAGADIVEMNTIRKRLSGVKGGKFAQHCAPARIYAIILSDIIGDPLDMIASGPACPDSSTAQEAQAIAEKYALKLSDQAKALLKTETPKMIDNVHTVVTGSVKCLCRSAERICRSLGYEPIFLTASLSCEAKEAGRFLASIARDHQDTDHSLAYLCGGETVVHLTGKGLGGRNQELALAAAEGISGLKDTMIFSLGSDGTDGPTDAAGGWVCGETKAKLKQMNLDIESTLRNNDAYHTLGKIGNLIITGPTGTNVNDLSVLLIKR